VAPDSKSTRRSYRQHCGVARALDVIGERWTLLIVRDLLLGPRRYSDLLRALPGVTTNLLAKRLQELEAAGVVTKNELAPPAAGSVYALTETGAALAPVITELGRWGGRFMGTPRRGDRLDVGWALLSTRRRYRGGVECVVDVRTDEGRRFELTFERDRLTVREGPSARPDVVVQGAAGVVLVAFASPDARAADAAARDLDVTGDRATWKAVLRALERGAPVR
jgi:DNA-binding HxlR family transcriptional regulator